MFYYSDYIFGYHNFLVNFGIKFTKPIEHLFGFGYNNHKERRKWHGR